MNHSFRLIMVVEDYTPTARVVERILRLEPGHYIKAFDTAFAALKFLKAVRAGRIITDPNMPELDGVGLYDYFRANPQIRDIPVLFMTAAVGTNKPHERRLAHLAILKHFTG